MGSRYVRVMSRMGIHVSAVSITGRCERNSLPAHTKIETLENASSEKVDLTVVASNTKRHLRDAEVFGDLSHFVLIEKPAAVTARQLYEFAPDLRARCAISSPLKTMHGFSIAKKSLGEIGRIQSIQIICHSWLPNWRPGRDYRNSYSADPEQGGVLLDLIHEIDYAISLFGVPDAIAAELSSDLALSIPVDTRADLTWHYPTFLLSMSLDFGVRNARRSLVVNGSQGVLEWDLLSARLTVTNQDSDLRFDETYTQDLHRDVLLQRQLSFIELPDSDFRKTSFEHGGQNLVVCDVARMSSRQGGIALPVHRFRGRDDH
jgi:predicted dehydrogenase